MPDITVFIKFFSLLNLTNNFIERMVKFFYFFGIHIEISRFNLKLSIYNKEKKDVIEDGKNCLEETWNKRFLLFTIYSA